MVSLYLSLNMSIVKGYIFHYSEGQLLLNHSFNTIVHVLDERHLREAESSLIGDVVDVVSGLRVFSVDTSDLDVVFVSDCLEFVLPSTQFGKLNVD